MIDQLEAQLRSELQAHVAEIPSGSAARLRGLDYHPRSRSLRPRVAAGAAGAAGVAGAVASIVTLGAGASPAFAGWSAKPTAATQGQVAGAESTCRDRLASLPGPPGSNTASLPAVLTDTRGPFTFVIFADANNSASCISGPSFTSIERNGTTGSAGGRPVSGYAAGAISGAGGPGSGSGAAAKAVSQSSASGMAGQNPTAGHIALGQTHLTTRAGDAYSFAEGRTGTGVTGVTLVLDDGTRVQASTANGWFVAWWPGSQAVASASVTTPTGTVTQPVPATPAAP